MTLSGLRKHYYVAAAVNAVCAAFLLGRWTASGEGGPAVLGVTLVAIAVANLWNAHKVPDDEG